MTASGSFAKTSLLDGGPVPNSLSLFLDSLDGSGPYFWAGPQGLAQEAVCAWAVGTKTNLGAIRLSVEGGTCTPKLASLFWTGHEGFLEEELC